MMKSILNHKTAWGLLLLTLPLSCPTLSAQTDETLDAELAGRISIGIDKKIAKGVHASLKEELRLDDNFSGFNRLQTTATITYKAASFLKIGIGYALINPYEDKTSHFKDARHRLMADATGTYRIGNCTLSLKERIQLTHRTGDFNQYQNPRNALTLKSRLMLKYKATRKLTPYGYVELRHYLNAPAITAAYDGDTYLTPDGDSNGTPGWFLSGFDSAYLNRMRGSVGIEYSLTKCHSINLAILADFVSDKVVDANGSGTKLKAYTHQTGFKGWMCAGYEYAF